MKNLKYFLPIFLIAAITIAGCKSDSTSPNNGNTGNGPAINSFTATPSTVDFSLGQDHSVLKWSTDGSETSVTIDQGVGDETNNSDDSVIVFPSQNTTYTLTAKNSSGTTTKTVTVSVNNPSQSGAPPIPQQLNASAGASSPSTIQLTWGASTGAATYIVERRLVGTTATSFFVITTAATGTSYNDVGLYPGFKYAYRVRSVSGSGAKSGYSNTATAVAPGQPPTINKIVLTPSSAPTLAPAQTQLFTALAFDASGNQLNFQPGAYQWMSDNTTIVSINDTGLATANQTSGSANITASLPNPDGSTVTSNSVNVAVAAGATHPTVVLYYGNSDMSQFADYLGPLASSGVGFDVLKDFSASETPAFTLQQLTPYTKVVVIVSNRLYMTDGAKTLLAEYAALGNKTLVIIGGGGEEQLTSGTLATELGVSNDGYQGINDINPQVVGQSGTAFANLTFTKQDVVDYVGDITLTDNSPMKPVLVGTLVSDNSPFTIAIQGSINVGNGSTNILYVSASIDAVDAANQNTFVTDFMKF